MSPARRRRKSRSKRARPRARQRAAFEPSKQPRVVSSDVVLLEGRERSLGKAGARRKFWRILHNGVQAGRVIIVARRPDDREDVDASITVELNQASRGRGIGTIAFRKASELSGYSKVYATMRKSNIASQIAATRAGFVPVAGEPTNELVLRWEKA